MVNLKTTLIRVARTLAVTFATAALVGSLASAANADTVQVNTWNGYPASEIGVQVTDGSTVTYSITSQSGQALASGNPGDHVQVLVTGQDLNSTSTGFDTAYCGGNPGFSPTASSVSVLIGSGQTNTLVVPQAVTQLSPPDQTDVEQFIAAVNQERAGRGMGPLAESQRLDDAANASATAMDIFTGCYFSQGLNAEGFDERWSELGVGTAGQTVPQLVGDSEAEEDGAGLNGENAAAGFEGGAGTDAARTYFNPSATYIGAAQVGYQFVVDVAGAGIAISGPEPDLPRTSPSAWGPGDCLIRANECTTTSTTTTSTATTVSTTTAATTNTTSQQTQTVTHTTRCLSTTSTATQQTTTSSDQPEQPNSLTVTSPAPIQTGSTVHITGTDTPGAALAATATQTGHPAQHAAATADSTGHYTITLTADSNLRVTVTDNLGATAQTVACVRPDLRAHTTKHNGDLTISGHLTPSTAGARVYLTVHAYGHTVHTTAHVKPTGEYTATIRMPATPRRRRKDAPQPTLTLRVPASVLHLAATTTQDIAAN